MAILALIMIISKSCVLHEWFTTFKIIVKIQNIIFKVSPGTRTSVAGHPGNFFLRGVDGVGNVNGHHGITTTRSFRGEGKQTNQTEQISSEFFEFQYVKTSSHYHPMNQYLVDIFI